MKKGFASIVFGLLLMVVAAAVHAQTAATAADGFDRLKTLVGEWQGTDESGKPVTSTFRVVSNGTALEETFQSENDNQMVTMYTPDGSRVA